MAFSMPPPTLGGFSLRVQLFSPTAHSLSDKPIRAFRVVTSPDVTIREFCQEASRIHEINYGEPIAIKKCQDDQEFDITQTEVVGILFTNTATIRVIQAPATPSIRDSIPPNSALRYDPSLNINHKRQRGGSAQPNGSPSNGWKPNKRQRVSDLDSDLDPDQPIQSSERDFENGDAVQQTKIVPDSHGSNAFVRGNGNARDVRAVIEETPPPESPQNLPTDQLSYKSPYAKLRHISQAAGTTSLREASTNPPRAKSASYHIQRATERGTSVSTAATSPLSGDQNFVQGSFTKRKVSDHNVNRKPSSRSPNEDSIYENIDSDSDEPVVALGKTKTSLKIRNSPQNGLPGLDWANNKFNTPPSGSRQSSRPREQPSSELPLTPSSREREEKQRQRKETDDAREAHSAAAEAAEPRKRGAEEAREFDEAQRLESDRTRREESERNTREKQKAVIAKAAKLEQERLRKEKERLAKLENEKKLAEESRLKKEKDQTARLEREKKARLEKEGKETQRIEQEKAQTLEAKRLREQEELKQAEKEAAAEELKKSKEKEKEQAEDQKKLASKASPPARGTPIRPQSSTPFIPSGRKSALKSSLSSHSSSPILIRGSPSGSSTDSIGQPRQRKVSFDDNLRTYDTPIRPGAKLPSTTPATTTPKPSVPSKTPNKVTGPPAVSTTRILPPSFARLSRERSDTPQRQTPPSTQRSQSLQPSLIKPPVSVSKIIPQVIIKSASPAILPSSNKSATPSRSVTSKEKSKSVQPVETIEISSDDSSDSDEDIPSRIDPVKLINKNALRQKPSPAPFIKPDPDAEEHEEDEDEDIEMTSNHSSSRESRSPVIFKQNTAPSLPNLSSLPEPANFIDGEATQSSTDSDEIEDLDDDEESVNEDQEILSSPSESEDEEEEAKLSAIQVPQSSPDLLRLQAAVKAPPPAPVRATSQIQSQKQPRSQSLQAVKSSPVPAPNSQRSGSFRVGASLQSLNETKPSFTAINRLKTSIVQPKVQEEEEEEEESSEDESDSSTSDEDSEDERAANTRNELAAVINKIGSQSSMNSQRVTNGRFASQGLSQSRKAGKELKGKRKDDKYLNGYQFSQPV